MRPNLNRAHLRSIISQKHHKKNNNKSSCSILFQSSMQALPALFYQSLALTVSFKKLSKSSYLRKVVIIQARRLTFQRTYSNGFTCFRLDQGLHFLSQTWKFYSILEDNQAQVRGRACAACFILAVSLHRFCIRLQCFKLRSFLKLNNLSPNTIMPILKCITILDLYLCLSLTLKLQNWYHCGLNEVSSVLKSLLIFYQDIGQITNMLPRCYSLQVI